MPQGRIKGLAGKPSVYHCMTRTVNGEFLFDDLAKETLREHLWQAAEFSGVHVLTYAILTNHFHVLVSVPDRTQAEGEITDAELVRRYRGLYPKPTRFRPAQICMLEAKLAAGGEEAAEIRRSLLDRMHDVSEFMKTVKQRFSVWFNRSHRRYGTLWADRFRSTLVEFANNEALVTVAAYIDLNPLRANLVSDPKDYRWSGYGEAVGGARRARSGLCRVQSNRAGAGTAANTDDWAAFAADYRTLLYCKGAVPNAGAAAVSEEQRIEVVRCHGRLPWPRILFCRIRALTDGAVLGSQTFVSEMLTVYREHTGSRRVAGPQFLPHSRGTSLLTLRGFPTTN